MVLIAICLASAYYSLRTRVEKEIGPWEQWVKEDPPGNGDYRKPRNLSARFWTGVPRSSDSGIGRLDRYGYTLGYSRDAKISSWAAVFLPQGKVPRNIGVSRGIWVDDPELGKVGDSAKGVGLTGVGQLVPQWMMDSFYDHSADTWNKSNRIPVRKNTAEAWNEHLGKIAQWALVYGGVVAFFGPVNHDDGSKGFFSITLRRGERGPEALSFLFTEPEQGGLVGGPTSVQEVEKITGLRFFADLPPEWRSYLRKKPPGKAWPG